MVGLVGRVKSKKKKTLLIAMAAVSLVGAGVGGAFALWPKPDPQKVIAEIGNDPAKIRQAVESGRISPQDVRASFETQMNQRLDGYFALQSPAQRTKYLDGIIDEMEARRKQFDAERAARGNQPRPERREGPGTRPSDAEMQRRQLERQNSTSPIRSAQRVEFMRAMMARRQERGLQGGGWGPGGGRGGPGGGDGGRGR